MALSNSSCSTVVLNPFSEDVQGHQCQLISSIQGLTSDENKTNNITKKQKKKKSHGNRKQQHIRRRLRRREQKRNNATTSQTDQGILIVIDDTDDDLIDVEQEQHTEQNVHSNDIRTGLENKRKRQENDQDDTQVNRSFSELSISQINTKKSKTTTENNPSTSEVSNVVSDANEELQHEQQKKQEHNKKLLSNTPMEQFKPSYLKVSDKKLKQMLSNAIEGDDKIAECLNTTEKIQFVRQMTEATNNLYYFDLQRQLWGEYLDLGLKQSEWAPRVSKSFAKKHHTCRTYGFSKHIIEQRLQTIMKQFQRTINELQQNISQLEHNAQEWQPYIDPAILCNAINACVQSAQQRLRQEFDYKKKMLVLDSNDRNLIRKFYDLKPNDEQVQLAIQVWHMTENMLKATAQEEVLRKRIFLRRLPSVYDKLINQSMDFVEPMLANEVLDRDRRASLVSNYSKTITQYKFDLMTLNLDTIQNIIRGHQQLLTDYQNKLSKCCDEILFQAIENRRQAMGKRHELYIKHKLNTFFDEAPATINE
ncbi:unnamed protein product [Rotaria sp. Silwood1]|nr:unnamed protein product [Rotaria sp. Silwood1]CAF1610756.1 unnamed protein product [Rotaria sp. Silwood1]CAF3719276.1 unnamed protein product [Rotaria sp. Silwood1]CAF3826306.1 unnamed protein product [Rotaria sp. Silwood1]CAF4823628.1 unnamed protein product [Rotaria sp. Silwood1]